MRRFGSLFGIAAAILAPVDAIQIALDPASDAPQRSLARRSKRDRITGAMPVAGGGAKERARNLKRIASGQITTANGLEHG